MKDLPNMGQKERGKVDGPLNEQVSPNATTVPPVPQPTSHAKKHPTPEKKDDVPNTGQTPKGRPTDARGWAVGLRQLFWERWRWGALIAIAVLVSRLTSSNA